jgi:hypothetical protein
MFLVVEQYALGAAQLTIASSEAPLPSIPRKYHGIIATAPISQKSAAQRYRNGGMNAVPRNRFQSVQQVHSRIQVR